VEWAALSARAEARDTELEQVKQRFSEITRQQVATFAGETVALAERLKAAGPGIPGTALPAGLGLLQAFQQEADALAKRREALRLAEQLFGMEATPYPALAEAEAELRRLAAVYGVYSEYADAVRQYSGQLWSELDVGWMVDGMQEIAAKLGWLQGVRDMHVYLLVEAEVAGFLEALPLMRELKSEALRPRHWRALMVATGQEFEMDPRTFTLANMFAMQLHRVSCGVSAFVSWESKVLVGGVSLLCFLRAGVFLVPQNSPTESASPQLANPQFSEEVGKITSSAVKELVIETELKKLADLWREQRFTLHKYNNVSGSMLLGRWLAGSRVKHLVISPPTCTVMLTQPAEMHPTTSPFPHTQPQSTERHRSWLGAQRGG